MSFGRAKWRSDPELLDRQRRQQQQLRVPTDQWNAMMEEMGMARDKDAREFDPCRADDLISQAFIDSAKKPALEPFLAFAHWLRARGWKTSELCQELIKADVEEGL